MVESLELRNFQSHKKTDLKFDPGVNVIIGVSDSGKSAVIRSLRWIMKNKPTNESVRSHWGGLTSVSLEIDGQRLERMRDKSKNEYWLNDEVYTAFGTRVPEEIEKVLGMEDVNFQFQMDRPFLMNESSGEVAKHFNRVAHLEKIDTALTRVNSWLRKASSAYDYDREKMREKTFALKELKYLDKAEAEIEILERREIDLSRQKTSLSTLQNIHSSYRKVEKQLTELPDIKNIEAALDSILELYDKVRKAKNAKKTLNKTIESYKDTIYQIEEKKKICLSEQKISAILRSYKQLKEKNSFIRRLKTLKFNFEKYEENLNRKTIELQNKKDRFQKEFPKICPLCGKTKKFEV